MTEAVNQGSESGTDAQPARTAARREAYAGFVAAALERQAAEIGRSWARRGAAAVGATRPDGQTAPADAATDRAPTEEIVRVLVGAIGSDAQWQEQVMRAGWSAGTGAFWREASLHQLLKELDAGFSQLLHAADAAAAEYTGPTTARDGLALARRLSDAAALLRLAAAGGYTRVMADDLRQRYRTIRHDLRNPLGTITTAVAMMDDETLPEATRQSPRMRAMVARNVRSMDAMISSALGDSAARLPAVALQTTSLRALACAVRGDLSATVDGVEVVVGEGLPSFPLDSAGLELLLKAVVLCLARRARGQAEIVIDLARIGPQSATLAVFASHDDAEDAQDLDLTFPRELVARLGGQVTGEGMRVLIEIPIENLPAHGDAAAHTPADASADAREEAGSVADAGDDVARERERPDGESRSL